MRFIPADKISLTSCIHVVMFLWIFLSGAYNYVNSVYYTGKIKNSYVSSRKKKEVANSKIYPSASNTIYTMFFAISYAFRVSRASTYILSRYVNQVYLLTVLSLKIAILPVKILSFPKYPRLNGHNFRFSIQGVNYHSGK